MKAYRSLLLPALVALLSGITCFAQDWMESTIIPRIELKDARLPEACKAFENWINAAAPDRKIKVQFDSSSIDPRVTLPTSTARRQLFIRPAARVAPGEFPPITLNLRDVPVRDCARYIADIAGVCWRFETNTIFFGHGPQVGTLLLTQPRVMVIGKPWGPFCYFYDGFERWIECDGKPKRLPHYFEEIPKATGSEVLVEPDLQPILTGVALKLPQGRLTAFRVLKAAIASLRRASGKEVVVYKSRSIPVSDPFCQTGKAITIGFRTKDLPDVRVAFDIPRDRKDQKPETIEQSFQRNLSFVREAGVSGDAFYEPDMNAIWIVREEEPSFRELLLMTITYFNWYNIIPSSSPSHIVTFGPKDEVIIRDGPPDIVPPKERSKAK